MQPPSPSHGTAVCDEESPGEGDFYDVGPSYPSALLDTDETTPQEPFQPAVIPWHSAPPALPSDRCDLNQAFRHSFWKQKRQAIADVLATTTTDQNRVRRYATCGSYAWVLRVSGANDRYRVVTNRCRDRFCEACQRERKQLIGMNLRAALPDTRLRFMTLTLKNSDQPLAEVLTRLIDSFGKLRRRRDIASCITGGVWFLEITRNTETQQWHPHLHVLMEGTFLPQQVLKRTWHEITKDSFIVDIRAIRDTNQAADYVCKYATKGCDASVWTDPVALQEAITALAARRTFNPFGTWTKLALSKTSTSDEAWEPVAPLWKLILNAQDGDEVAQMILSMLRRTPDAPVDLEFQHDPPGPLSDLR